MHHLVFIGREHLKGHKAEEQLAAVGLADHGVGASTVPVEGPDGKTGTLFGWGNLAGRFSYTADRQTWSPAAQHEDAPVCRFYVGTWNDSPPTPHELRRPGREAWGEPVSLGGQEWLLPPIDLIPKVLAQFPDGTSGLRVKPEFAHLAEDRLAWKARLNGPRQLLPLVDAARFVVSAMALNYRMDLTLAIHLGLFDEENIQELLLIALRPRGFYLQPTEA